jgi:hypothetical protein
MRVTVYKGASMGVSLDLPQTYRPRRILGNPRLSEGQRLVLADIEGPGCIRRISGTLRPYPMHNRRAILRIYWDDEEQPSVEAPWGDFFGMCHGIPFYPLDTPYIAAAGQCGLTAYFAMPFQKRARIEIEVGPLQDALYHYIDWHAYPQDAQVDPLRFHAQWRREFPTQAFGEEYLLLDTAGRGQLLGFNYGVRLYDDAARWSHGGAENIYLDGESRPAFLRGSGGEDTFGASYGGVLHIPDSHLYQGIPYYVHDDIGQPKAVQRLAAYRFFEHDALPFQEHAHFRFGCVANDICSTAYWYQTEPHRPFFRMPEWKLMEPGTELPRGSCDLPLGTTGSWWLCGPFEDEDGQGMARELPPEREFDPNLTCDGGFGVSSPWRQGSVVKPEQHIARWSVREAIDGFIDFNLVYRPQHRGVSVTWPAVAYALGWLHSPRESQATLNIAWDDELVVWLNDERVLPRAMHSLFDEQQITVRLRPGPNKVLLKLNNRMSASWGAWCFAFAARLPDGPLLRPSAEKQA